MGDLFSGRPLQSLTREEAKLVLLRFLEIGRDGVAECSSLARRKGFDLDLGERSLFSLFQAVGDLLTFDYRPLPNDLPQWIRETPIHSKGLVEFSEESSRWIMRVAYYLGECFVHWYPKLTWDVGDPNFAHCNMPVVSGFRGQVELPPLVVTEGMYVRVLAQGKSWDNVTTMIKSWRDSV